MDKRTASQTKKLIQVPHPLFHPLSRAVLLAWNMLSYSSVGCKHRNIHPSIHSLLQQSNMERYFFPFCGNDPFVPGSSSLESQELSFLVNSKAAYKILCPLINSDFRRECSLRSTPSFYRTENSGPPISLYI